MNQAIPANSVPSCVAGVCHAGIGRSVGVAREREVGEFPSRVHVIAFSSLSRLGKKIKKITGVIFFSLGNIFYIKDKYMFALDPPLSP